MNDGSGAPLIMLVDDEPDNLEILGRMLRIRGFRLAAFPTGELALRAASETKPDLILLDIMMPGIDGYQVCRRLKADPRLRAVPVLFLSALDGTRDKVRAFAAGAVDYITKPLSEAEVLARVETHLALHRHSIHLEEVVRARTAELVEANRRLKAWDEATNDWLMMLSHELRTPLTAILGITDLLFDEAREGTSAAALRAGFESNRRRIEELIQASEMLGEVGTLADRFTPVPAQLECILAEAVVDASGAGADGIRMDTPTPATVLCDPDLLRRALRDLLLTAACCIRAHQSVAVQCFADGTTATVAIRTNGPHLSAEALESFFRVGGQRDLVAPGCDYRLRPSLALRIAQRFGGSATVANRRPDGVEIRMTLPQAGLSPAGAGRTAKGGGSHEP